MIVKKNFKALQFTVIYIVFVSLEQYLKNTCSYEEVPYRFFCCRFNIFSKSANGNAQLFGKTTRFNYSR
jgi:hypothetical protein